MASIYGDSGQFKAPQAAQSQDKPGLEKYMQPPSESTKFEGENGFVEYIGTGKLQDKKVLITGGDSGIGRAVAVLMAREGADITIVYLPQEQPDAEDTKKMIEKENRQCLLLPTDLAKRENCQKVVNDHVKKFGHINVLVNNAAKQYMVKDFVKDTDLDMTEDLFNCNVIQMIALSKFALPHMKKGDSIINSTSVTTFRGSSGMIDYAASKGAIVGFTRALGLHLVPKGIRVNAVAPGAVYTPIQPDTREAEQMVNWGASSKLGRPAQPSEVAASYIFLASREAALYCK
ncbi:KR domain protein [Aspergillus sclerotialis]|uniref:KR domain protein n=1 Tax=Aspergillus sclerotialis TaxID=2070753 RepID=A0A3A2Z863_9EURO|nr:KR domain protein [Aspergillus sclerotialis]